MILKMILLFCFLPIVFIIHFLMRNEAKPKKNIILGTTLPFGARQDPAVQSVVRRYLRRQTLAFVLLLLLAVPPLFIRYSSIVMTCFFVWLSLVITLPLVLFAVSNRSLMELKRQNGWFGESAGMILVDMRLALAPKKALNIWLFLPPVIASLIPAANTLLTLRGKDEFPPLLLVHALMAATVLACWFIYRIIFHQKAEVVDENTTVNAALTRVRRYNWGKCWLFTAWLTGFFNLAFWLLAGNMTAVLAATMLYSVLLMALIMNAEFKTRNIQQKLTADSGRSVYADEDDRWLFGMLYSNPDDGRFLVNHRTGIGTSVNLAHPAGRAVAFLCTLLVLALPLFGVWMIGEEFTPVTLVVGDSQLTAAHGSSVYHVDLGEIASYELIGELPSGTRTMGTAMDTVLKGRFSFEGIGPCSVCLDPRTPPFLVIAAGDGVYVLGAADGKQTRDVYEALTARVKTAGASGIAQ